ncbi:hypothetical protein Areg01_82640 [Actinoplanes regularis]|nr:hypothetical protein Areg01_82640 [Actinoplanes regularis]
MAVSASAITASGRLCRSSNDTAITAVAGGNICGRPTGGFADDLANPVDQVDEPVFWSPVILSPRSGRPTISFRRKMTYRIPVAAADSRLQVVVTLRSHSK